MNTIISANTRFICLQVWLAAGLVSGVWVTFWVCIAFALWHLWHITRFIR